MKNLNIKNIFITISIFSFCCKTYAVDPDFTFTGCTAFPLNSGLYSTHEFQGQVKCYDTYSADPIKLEALAIDQPPGVDYNIYVYWYNSTTASLEFQALGSSTGNADERVQDVVPAGNYVIYTEAANGSSTSQFVVAALGYLNFDIHEMNDTALTATQL